MLYSSLTDDERDDMNMLRIVILLLIAGTGLGCLNNRITKGYDFSDAQMVIDHKDMEITAQLIGTLSPGEKEGRCDVTIRRTPYTLMVNVMSETGFYRFAQLSRITLVDERDNRVILPSQPRPAGCAFTETMLGYHAQISIDSIDLPHEKLLLTADIEIYTMSNSVIKQAVEFQFFPRISETKSRDNWFGIKRE